MGWNGLELTNEFAKELGDVSSQFKNLTLQWINDGIQEIATAHQWAFLREKGMVVLTQGKDTHPIVLAKPGAPEVAIKTGGALIADTPYQVLVTFYEEQSKVESIAGEATLNIIPTGTALSIELSNIPVSSSPLVTARKVYVSKNGAKFQYAGTITNNASSLEEADVDEFGDPVLDIDGNPVMIDVPVTFTVLTDPTSMVTPPEENAIWMIDGQMYREGQRVIHGTSVQDLVFRSGALVSLGTPEMWAPINQEEIQVYPKPATNTTVSFYYFKLPSQVFYARDSIPQLPSWLKHDLKNYVIWRGYAFRDRAGTESKKLNYDQDLAKTISRKGKPIKRSGRVRCVTPDSDGYGV